MEYIQLFLFPEQPKRHFCHKNTKLLYMRIVVCLLAFMASVFTTSAVIIDTPCMGCLTTMEAMYLLSREAKMANGELPFVNDIAMMLCHSSYFNLFIDGVQDGCRAMLEADPDSFKSAISEVLGTDADIYTPNGAKLNYFHFAKKVLCSTYVDMNVIKAFLAI